MHRDSDTKRRRILRAAARLLAKQGYDGMTLAAVSQASGAAIGSIIHFFDDKAGLAAAIHDDLAKRLTADADKALQAAHGSNVAAAVEALLSAVLDWPKKFPENQRLIEVVAAFTPKPAQGGIEQCLAQVLARWAEPLIRVGAIAPFSPSQFYAVMVAPALCTAAPAVRAEATRQEPAIDWLSILTAAALTAITAGTKARGGAKHEATAKARRGKTQLTLLD